VAEFLLNVLIGFWPFWVVLAVAVAAIMLLRMYAGGDKRLPYQPRERLVTKAELRFYKSLRKAVLDDWEIFVMVRIADILRVEPGVKNRRGWLNKILAKHIDFVLCNPNSLEIVMGIELDDNTHQRADRIERDQFVDHAFESAGIPLLRVPVRANYQAREVRELIDGLLLGV
jgi:hypothetical protein